MRQPVAWGPRGAGEQVHGRAWIVHPPVLALLLVVLWVGLALAVNTAQYGDHFEQFAWAQTLEWGYHKHPPLPTWLLGAAIRLGGFEPWWPSVLAAGCIGLNLVLTWRIGCWLLGAERAGLAVLLTGLQQGFAGKAQLFNHNSVMVVCVSLVVWLSLRVSQRDPRSPRTLWCWVWIGVCAGLALLAKYQSALPLLGVLVALGLSGALRHPAQRRGVALAVLLAVLMFLPHLSWVATHGWSTLAYATQAGVELTFGERVGSLVKFLIIQVRILGPALLLFGLAFHLAPRVTRSVETVAADPPARDPGLPERSVWLIGLVGVPVAGVAITALLGGLRLQDHWGIQTFQYFGLLLAAAWPASRAIDGRRILRIALVLHLIWMVAYTAPRWIDAARSDRQRLDEFFPAQQIADAVGDAWRGTTTGDCPLRYVRGPGFEAGLVSVYLAAHPASIDENLLHTPWIDPARLLEAGHVHVRLGQPPDRDEWSGTGTVLRGQFDFEVPAQRRQSHQTLHWMIVLPEKCTAPAP
jgi:hypothetical protein